MKFDCFLSVFQLIFGEQILQNLSINPKNFLKKMSFSRIIVNKNIFFFLFFKRWPSKGEHLFVESRGLHSRARYQTRRDWTRLETIPKLPGPGRDYFFMVPLLGKIREKFGTGRDYSVLLGKSLGWS